MYPNSPPTFIRLVIKCELNGSVILAKVFKDKHGIIRAELLSLSELIEILILNKIQVLIQLSNGLDVISESILARHKILDTLRAIYRDDPKDVELLNNTTL